MPKDDTLDNTNVSGTSEDGTSTYTPPPTGETQSEPKGDQSSAKTYTEAQYKGLQAVIAKKDALIAKQTTEIADLQTKLVEAEANHGSALSEKEKLSGKLTESTGEVDTLNKKVAELQRKLNHQDIIMKDFPDLAPAAYLLADTESEEEYRESAKALRATLKQYQGTAVKNAISGSSPPIEDDGGGSSLNVDELDKAYKEVTALAGIPGKEQEYEKANQRYIELMQK